MEDSHRKRNKTQSKSKLPKITNTARENIKWQVTKEQEENNIQQKDLANPPKKTFSKIKRAPPCNINSKAILFRSIRNIIGNIVQKNRVLEEPCPHPLPSKKKEKKRKKHAVTNSMHSRSKPTSSPIHLTSKTHFLHFFCLYVSRYYLRCYYVNIFLSF